MRKIKIFWVCGFFCIVLIGSFLGFLIALTVDVKNNEHFTEFSTTLPTKLLDINGELITEFASDEKREIIEFSDLPQHMVDALITREDNIFFKHSGFSIKAIFRAVIGQLTGRNLGGGSTLTQQIAGTLYLDRREISITRKIKELWWAIQIERRYSKEEILELYLNTVFFGGGTYGVNSASKYYFGHDVQSITPAESAILVIQLSSPTEYNPFNYPNRAMDRQEYVLDEMVNAGFLTHTEASQSFEDFWLNFDYTRISSSAYYMRDDKAPWFSEYVRRELESMMYGTMNLYTDGYTVYTTMDMHHQAAAQRVIDYYIIEANRRYDNSKNVRVNTNVETYAPLTELLSLVFNIPELKVSEQRIQSTAIATYKDEINPLLDIFSLMFNIDELKVGIVNRTNIVTQADSKKTTIEGTMVALENETGYITALVGGSAYGQDNQFIRATQALLQPGSAFKPLYYAAAIETKTFTATSSFENGPYVFENADGTPYMPQNFLGQWTGSMQLWEALAQSMNIPSLKILEGVGFNVAIDYAAKLLGIPQTEYASRNMMPVYPLGLGVSSATPIEVARAFAIFGNEGAEVIPMAIRSVEDRYGNVIIESERDIRLAQQEKGADAQILSPQTAYIMTDLLQNTLTANGASLRNPTYYGERFTYKNQNGDKYILPVAGKTGTTQNWADAWTVGFSPYYTSAFWFGFDSRGQSLGLDITGSTLTGWAWAEFMYAAHEHVSYKDFPKPISGLEEVTVCYISGQLMTSACNHGSTTQWFLSGTEPTALCEYHTAVAQDRLRAVEIFRQGVLTSGVVAPEIEEQSDALQFDLSFLDEITVDFTAPENNNEIIEPVAEPENRLPTRNSLLD